MFSNITPQRQSLSLLSAQKYNIPQTTKHYLNIAVGIALTCLTVQAQAANKAQTYNELPLPEA
ncbi:hypothetical protein CAN34_13995, partial [Psychrobacter sp. DAB_AL32B]